MGVGCRSGNQERLSVVWVDMRRAAFLLALSVVAAACGGPGAAPAGSADAAGTAWPSASGTAQSTVRSPDATFPSEVSGLSVVSVARAAELLGSGALDGQAVAVDGYYNAGFLPCPYPGRYIGPLESWCRLVAFTDTRASANLCQPAGANRTRCSQPSGTNLAPFFMSETSGDAQSWLTAGATEQPAALVLIGHAGDARQWQCTAATQAECASAFVVDRIAWADGQAVPPAAPETGDQQTGEQIAPRMTLGQVVAAIGLTDELLTGAAFRAGDIATVDPRWNLAGDDVVWLVRSLGQAAASGAAETRPETVWLVDDATGRVIDSHPLKLARDYQPARLWQMATAHGVECCSGDPLLAVYRVASGDGTAVYEGEVRGGVSGGTDATTYGGGYRSTPLVLPAGGYSVTAWLARYADGVVASGTARGECSTQVTLRPLDDVGLNADFPAGKACTFQPVALPTSGP